jgi:hypothetical protein
VATLATVVALRVPRVLVRVRVVRVFLVSTALLRVLLLFPALALALIPALILLRVSICDHCCRGCLDVCRERIHLDLLIDENLRKSRPIGIQLQAKDFNS